MKEFGSSWLETKKSWRGRNRDSESTGLKKKTQKNKPGETGIRKSKSEGLKKTPKTEEIEIRDSKSEEQRVFAAAVPRVSSGGAERS